MKSRLFLSLLIFFTLGYLGAQAEAQNPLQTTEGVMAQLERHRTDFFLVDVRISSEFRQKRIPGSINIPVERITLELPTRNMRAQR